MERPAYVVAPIDLFDLLPPERWFAEARDYLASGVHLLRAMVDGSLQPSWPRAKAAGFLYAHALELMLKAALAQAELKIPRTHDLKKLMHRYSGVYKDEACALGQDIAMFVAENERLPFATFLKYAERIGDLRNTWTADLNVDLRAWSTRAARVLERMDAIRVGVMAKYPRNPEFWHHRVDVELE
jgi:HEPN domain